MAAYEGQDLTFYFSILWPFDGGEPVQIVNFFNQSAQVVITLLLRAKLYLMKHPKEKGTYYVNSML